MVVEGGVLRRPSLASDGSAFPETAVAPKTVTLRMDVESVEYRVHTEGSELFSSSSGRSGNDGDMGMTGSADLERLDDASMLINNPSAKALTEADQASKSIHRFLAELGIRVRADQMQDDMDLTASTSFGQGTTNTGASNPAHQVSNSRWGGSPPDALLRNRSEQQLLQRLFRYGISDKYVVRDQHVALGRVLQSIFRADERQLDLETTTDSFGPSLRCRRLAQCLEGRLPTFAPYWRRVRKASRRIINNPVFSGFFLALTIYSLFSLDLVVVFGTKEVDEPFWIAGSVVFFLFFLELVVWTLGVRGYILTLPFLLDLTALVSVYGDTWFSRQGGFLSENDQASRLSRMARTSKMTRLARIVRVARITKLIPELLRFLRKQNTLLARQIQLRRLWRVFLFLEADEKGKHKESKDGRGMLSSFDVKVFYTAAIQECPHLFFCERLLLLQRDVPRLEVALECEDETRPHIDFDTFDRIIESTELGKNMVQFHTNEVEQEEGVWTLTKRLSDRTAMKVCVGILLLISMVSFLEVLPEDNSVRLTLAQLTAVAREERQGGITDMSYLCDQIGIFVDRMRNPQQHKVLFLFLDGFLHYDFDRGGCLDVPDNTTDVLQRAEEIRAQSSTRNTEFTWICWPVKCVENFASACLVDQSIEEQNHSKWAVVTILMVIVLLLIFVYGLNQKIRIFSGKLLQPLQTLLDDMSAMACLELVHLDKEMPTSKGKPVQVAEELEHLQTAFKGMRSAIRSWSKYVPPCIVERFLTGTEATVGVARCHATILFADIVDFEVACKGLLPDKVLELLTNVFGCISDCVSKRNGVLLEFIGHEVLAVFNTPSSVKYHALAGVLTALDIHRVVKDRVQVTADDREVVISCYCGVHTGQTLAGNIGSHRRMKYGLLGDSINLAARLKGLNSRYQTQTLVSSNVLAEDKNRAKLLTITRPVDCVAVKGKSEPTTVHQVIGYNGHHDPQMTQAAKIHTEAFELYQARHFKEAMEKFSEVSGLYKSRGETDEPSRLLEQRCVAYLKDPPPADWDGVDRLNKKTFDVPAPSAVPLAAPGMTSAGGPRVVSMTVLPLVPCASPSCSDSDDFGGTAERIIHVREDLQSGLPGSQGNEELEPATGCSAALRFCAMCDNRGGGNTDDTPMSEEASIAREDGSFAPHQRFVPI